MFSLSINFAADVKYNLQEVRRAEQPMPWKYPRIWRRFADDGPFGTKTAA